MGEAITFDQYHAVSNVLLDWCTCVDEKDWRRLRGILCDTVTAEYEGNARISGEMPAEDWIRLVHRVSGFHRTLHRVTNIRVEMNGDEAVCSSYISASHFFKDGPYKHGVFACGKYRHTLQHVDGVWKIRKAYFALAGRMTSDEDWLASWNMSEELGGPPPSDLLA